MPGTVVFDLDGTLVTGDAFGCFLSISLRRNPLRLASVVCTAPWWVSAGLRRGGRERAELLLIWSITVGRSRSGLQRAFDEFAATHVRGRIGVALDRLAEHLAAGDQVVVATACAEPLAWAVCAELGLAGGVRVVASPFAHRRGLTPRAVAIRGELKLEALQRAGVRLPVANAYSDDVRDLPLLRAAVRAHLVRPTAADERAVRADLGDVEVLR